MLVSHNCLVLPLYFPIFQYGKCNAPNWVNGLHNSGKYHKEYVSILKLYSNLSLPNLGIPMVYQMSAIKQKTSKTKGFQLIYPINKQKYVAKSIVQNG